MLPRWARTRPTGLSAAGGRRKARLLAPGAHARYPLLDRRRVHCFGGSAGVLRRVGKHILLIRSSRIRGNSAPFPAILQPIGIRQTRRTAGLEPANGTSPGKAAAYALEPPRAPPCASRTGSAALQDVSYQILPPPSRKKSCGPGRTANALRVSCGKRKILW